jgi:integrase
MAGKTERSFQRRTDAERFLTSITADVLHGNYVDSNDPTTFREYAETWREAQVHRPATRAHVETHLRRHAYPAFGSRRLCTVRHDEIQAWVTEMSRALAPSTVQVIHGIVAAIFKAAVKDRLINTSPCEGTKLPKRLPVEVVPLSTSAVQALINAVPERYRALVVLAAGTGLRQGECFGLTDERIDLDNHSLRVEQQLILLARQPPLLAPPKTPASHRTVPLPDVVMEALRGHLERFPVQHPDGLLFTDDDGNALRRTAFSREIWRPAVNAASAPRGTGFHALRHYYASLLIRHGESIKTVQRRLGHATAAEPSTPTPISGRTPTTAPATPSTRPCAPPPRQHHRDSGRSRRQPSRRTNRGRPPAAPLSERCRSVYPHSSAASRSPSALTLSDNQAEAETVHFG